MTESSIDASPPDRDELETAIARDIRALTAVSDRISHLFAHSNELRPNDFRALMHIATADAEGTPLTAGRLGTLLGVSPGAITYLIERMIESGHIEREPDDADKRRVLLHYSDHGMSVAAGFFTPIGMRTRTALAGLPDADLQATHRVLTAIVGALRDHSAAITSESDRPNR
ncbi:MULTISPECIES: MarR family winged helix-turn-helix transcriptional regulator [Nocardia]|uniref:MarR family transcriptional regulator n=2 Tax=Nocardia TaxID=1817 RepID=A0A2T2Z8X5_9NOCA|nr:MULTISPECIES: MarR family winged helix-turn-helix transcriptional regulator [Nocardia]MBF6446270.1 winged helix-turn-helix transcriptional regulator [Nocardia elegans]PSR64216.1 MarR family transcriptional regulator [Nocardia nova]